MKITPIDPQLRFDGQVIRNLKGIEGNKKDLRNVSL